MYQKTKYNGEAMQPFEKVHGCIFRPSLFLVGPVYPPARLCFVLSCSISSQNFLASYNRVIGGIFMFQHRGVRYNADAEECGIDGKYTPVTT